MNEIKLDVEKEVHRLIDELTEVFYDTINELLSQDYIDDSALKRLNEEIVSYVKVRNYLEDSRDKQLED